MRVKIKTVKIKEFLRKLPRRMAERAFFTLMVLVFLGLIFGGLLFYQYSMLAQKVSPQVTEKPLNFKEKIYQEVLDVWRERERKFEEADTKEYPDLFWQLTE